jgi:pimeloyl-ACP methyl ester carboxylesterase
MLPNDAVEENIVPLSFLETSVNNGEAKQSESLPTLLIHGLDSSSHTWRGLLDDLGATGFDAMAVDQRGCGRSPLGDPELFSPDALVDDLYAFVSSHPMFQKGRNNATIKPFVLVGHSMGGRVAMSFAAKHPELIAALVIEDMDVQIRSLSISSIRSKDRDATVAFDRRLTGISTPKEIVEAFVTEGYESSRVEKWLSEGRVEAEVDREGSEGGYYSHVNPAFRLLCYEQFFETNHGEDTWKKLSTIAKEHGFPIHLMIADPDMTICDEASISIMTDAMEESPALLKIYRYQGATHSIHNSVAEDFTSNLKAIIQEAGK